MNDNLLSETMQKSMHSPEIEVDKRLTQPWGEFLKDYIEVRLDEMQDSRARTAGTDRNPARTATRPAKEKTKTQPIGQRHGHCDF